jgi:hypothetical protein
VHTTSRALVAVVLLSGLAAISCREQPEPLRVEGGRIVVSNLTSEPWTDVEVWLNGYYLARAAQLPPGGRLDAPLIRFQNGFGRYFDPKREPIREVKATAKTRTGMKLEFRWPAPGSRGTGAAGRP